MLERGFEATSMDEISRRSGVSKRTLYRHWPSKEDLLVEALGQAPDDVEVRQTDDPRADAVRLLQELVRTLERTAGGLLLPRLVGAAVDNPQLRRIWQEELTPRRRHPVVAILRAARDRGDLSADTDLELAADQLVAPVIYRWLVSGAPLAADLPEQLVDAVFRAWAP